MLYSFTAIFDIPTLVWGTQQNHYLKDRFVQHVVRVNINQPKYIVLKYLISLQKEVWL